MFIRYFFNLCFPLVLLNAPLAWSVTNCQDHFSSGNLVIDFTKSVRGNSFSKKWENQVLQSFSSWSREEVESFLNELSQRISKDAIIKGLKDSFHFRYSNYEKFKKTVAFYEDYTGAIAVKKKLEESLGDFFYSHAFDEIKPVPELLEIYMEGKDKVQVLMEKDLRAFSLAQVSELKPVLEFLETYLRKEQIETFMTKDLRAFSLAQVSELKPVLEFLETYLKKEQIETLMEKD
ncbi:MAG: hypothetical protein OXJ52_01890, partial [Oligoflexia bacterium]|nr:hypothetical protein [Oligoflexia bacterium]